MTVPWRAVDHEGDMLEAFVSKAQDRKGAIKFLCKRMKATKADGS